MHKAMLTAKAVGGPRDGVKLSAVVTWDGIVRYITNHGIHMHPGHYKWRIDCWKWIPGVIPEVRQRVDSRPINLKNKKTPDV